MPGKGSRAVSIPEAMRILGVSRNKIHKMIGEGILSAVKLGEGSAVRITMKSIDDLLGDTETQEAGEE